MSLQIPKFSETPQFCKEVIDLFTELSDELKIPESSIPEIANVFMQLTNTIEERYCQLTKLLTANNNSEVLALKEQIRELKENKLKSYYSSNN